MVTQAQISTLIFDHIVVFKGDKAIFACAKINGSGSTRIFLAFDNGRGRIYSRNGRAESWELIHGGLADDVRGRITTARNNHIPAYTLNSGSQEVTAAAHA